METINFKLTIHIITPILGSQSTRDVASEFIAKRAGIVVPDDEEATLPEELERGTTVFHRDPAGQPMLLDYQFKGFLKNAGKVLNGKAGMPKNLRAKVNDCVFVSPRFLKLRPPNSTNGQGCLDLVDYFERPLRIEGAMGQRVALARSEQLPEGVWFTCGISVIPHPEMTEYVLRELLDYGFYCGIGQFRSGSYGQFRYELVREE